MVLKRYTPPTCTLEITAKSSPLSRWAGQPLLKSLSFELRLDDPRLPETEHVTLRGDRTQLEALHEAVSTYVQNFLTESRVWESSLTSEVSHTVSEADSPQATRSPVMLGEAVNAHEIATSPPNTSYLPVHPHLEPRGLLAHNLFLGSLSVAESGPVVPLSTLQLFDLATALDEYAAEVMALPKLKRSPGKQFSAPWLGAAAMVVAIVGLTVNSRLRYQPPRESQTASAPAQQAIGTPGSPLVAATPTATPTVTPTVTLPPLPPPPIDAIASVSPSLPPIALSSTPATNKPSPIQQPPLLFPANDSPAIAPPPSQEQVITIPAPVEAPISATQPPPVPNRLPPLPPRLAPAVAPPMPPLLPPLLPRLSASRLENPQPQSAIPPIGAIVPPGSTELPTLEDAQPKAESEDSQQAAANQKNRTLFDTIPQVSEARAYFEERWKPTEDMQETLEYSVQIDEKGSIQSIMPMGKAAGDYIDRTNMPLVGEPFVSAVSNGNNPRIRVVLRPNGRVQTFLEATN
ncbi:MAG TPA: hypothetical protein DGO89_22995 [Microcoleaceae bacterium UBA9251]|nr:hypothetical protein [Microcoleaceae cyanobacterium UBA9251]